MSDIEGILGQAFHDEAQDYENLLLHYYPAHGSTGFTERNQTCSFVHNLLLRLDRKQESKPFAWYEAPLPDNGHMDAVVFAPADNAVFYIEAKRLDHILKKKEEIFSDAQRIKDYKTRSHILREYRYSSSSIRYEYLVYLADVWLENAEKKRIPFWWTGTCQNDLGEEPLPQEIPTFCADISKKLNITWPEGNQFIYRFHVPEPESWRRKYRLLMGFLSLPLHNQVDVQD